MEYSDYTNNNSYTANNIITSDGNNPAFNIKLRDLSNPNEAPGNVKNDINIKKDSDKFKIGDIIHGKSISNNKEYKGRIIYITKNEKNEISNITIINKNNNENIKLEPSSCEKIIKNKDDKSIIEIPYTTESKKYIKTFEEFILSNIFSTTI